ncbi:MAG: SPFH domain-containing protein [Myxococcota bacterium]
MSAPPSSSGLSTRAKARLIFLGILALLGLLGFNTSFDYVQPFEVGIKESRYAGGIQQESLGGGRWYLTGPGVYVHRFPITVQAVEFTGVQDTARTPNTYTAARVEVDTQDGSKMHADVTVLYRVTDAYKVFREFGPGRGYENNAVVPRAQAALKENLGKLLAEDFYNEELRLKQTHAALLDMRPKLEQSGIHVEHVLIRQYYYNKDYQRQIESRKVQDQLVFTQQSRAESAKQDALRRKIVAEGEAAVGVEKRRGEAEITRIQAEASLYARKKRAEGDLLVALAQARGTELENAAYEGVGSENIVAENMAEVLKGMDVIVLSDTGKNGGFNPLDVDALLKMFGARAGGTP